MFRPHGASRVRHLRPLATPTLVTAECNCLTSTTSSSSWTSCSTLEAAASAAHVPPLSAASTSSPPAWTTAPLLTPIVRQARVGVHALSDQPIRAPALARQAQQARRPYHHAQNDVSRLTMASCRPCWKTFSRSCFSPSSRYSRPWSSSSLSSSHTPYPRLPLHPLHPSSSSRPSPRRLSNRLGPFHAPASPHQPLQARGRKTKTTVKLSDLPQGLIPPGPQPSPSRSRPQPKKSQDLQNSQDSQVSQEPRDPQDPLQDPSPSTPRSCDRLPQDDEPAYPTVVLQARQNMRRFENCVLLTRVGGFYELYFEHADEYGPLLNLKVASKKTSAGPVPMVS